MHTTKASHVLHLPLWFIKWFWADGWSSSQHGKWKFLSSPSFSFIFWPLYVNLYRFLFDFFNCSAKNFTHFPHLGSALSEYNAFQESLTQQSDTLVWNVDEPDAVEIRPGKCSDSATVFRSPDVLRKNAFWFIVKFLHLNIRITKLLTHFSYYFKM